MDTYYKQLRVLGLTAVQAFAGKCFAEAYERYNGRPAPESYLRDVVYIVRRASFAGLLDLIAIAKTAK